MSDITTICRDCHVARELAGLTACPRHATAEERAEAERRISELVMRDHPLMAAMRKPRRYEP